MRALYQKYYKERKRGFTDQEFREECDSAVGVRCLSCFEYASTVKDIDYPKYLAMRVSTSMWRQKSSPVHFWALLRNWKMAT